MKPAPHSAPFRRVPPAALPELMDRADCDPGALRDALRTIDREGRWTGRDRILREGLERLLAGTHPGELALLDVGAGAGHGTLRLARALLGRGWRPRVVLADLHAGALGIARERARLDPAVRSRAIAVRLVRLTGASLPFREECFDVTLSSNTLHHLSGPAARRMLAEMARVSRRGFVLADLRRSRLAHLGARLLARTLWRRHPLPRHDGPRSVRRAFTPREARLLAAEAGLPEGRVTAGPLWLGIRWRRRNGA